MKLYQLCYKVYDENKGSYVERYGVNTDEAYVKYVASELNYSLDTDSFYVAEVNQNQEDYFYVQLLKTKGKTVHNRLYNSLYIPMGKETEYVKYMKQNQNETVEELLKRAEIYRLNLQSGE